jgi:hypothetical protein
MRIAACLLIILFSGGAVAGVDEAEVRHPLVLTSGWGTIEGQFTLDGKVPAPLPPLVKNPPAGVPAVPDESLLIDAETEGIANLVVYLRESPKTVHPQLAKSAETVVELTADAFRFKPRILHVRTDQRLRCRSADGRVYNVHVNPIRNSAWNLAIGGTFGDRTLSFQHSERLPIEVKSGIQHWMRAWCVVTDHPYVAVTDREGRFRIEGLPAGEHSFILWHEKAGYIERQWTVEARSGEVRRLPATGIPSAVFKMDR